MYGTLCDGDMWGESGRVGCIPSSVGSECGGWWRGSASGGWTDVGGGWTWESGGGQVRGGWIDELVYLVSVWGVVCV